MRQELSAGQASGRWGLSNTSSRRNGLPAAGVNGTSARRRASFHRTRVFEASIPPGLQLLLGLTYSCVTFQTHSKGIFPWESVSSLWPHADNRPLCVYLVIQRALKETPNGLGWTPGLSWCRCRSQAAFVVLGVKAGRWGGKSVQFRAADGSVTWVGLECVFTRS